MIGIILMPAPKSKEQKRLEQKAKDDAAKAKAVPATNASADSQPTTQVPAKKQKDAKK